MHAWVFHQGMYATSRTGLLVLALVYATFKVSNKVDALLRVLTGVPHADNVRCFMSNRLSPAYLPNFSEACGRAAT